MASGIEAAKKLIVVAIDAAWAAQTPIAYPNARFTPPNGSWIKVDVLWGDAFMVSMGNTTTDTGSNQIVGMVQVAAYVRKGTSEATLNGLVDDVRDMLNRLRLNDSLSGLQFGAPSGPARLDEAEWFGVAVRTPFEMFEAVT